MEAMKKLLLSTTMGVVIAATAVAPVAAQRSGPPPIPGQTQATPSAVSAPMTVNTGAPMMANSPPLLIDQAEAEIGRQGQGSYPELDRNQSDTVGSLQRAWDQPRASSGQTSPGIIRYAWQPNLVMAIRTREFMVTTINLPEWERLTNIIVGDPVVFEARQIKPNMFAIRPTNGGADTNVTAIGVSGNVYSFYVRSEGWNTENISDLTVFVDRGSNGTGVRNVGSSGSAPGSRSSVTAISDVLSDLPSVDNSYGGSLKSSLYGGGAKPSATGFSVQASSATPGSSSVTPPDYLREIAFKPENLQFNMRIFAPDPQSAEIAPVRVFNDGVWTYFDFGDKADAVRRPVAFLVVDGVDSMVNTRTAGPSGNILIAEAVGDFTLRNGNRVVCIYREDSPRLAKRQGSSLFSSPEPAGSPGLGSQQASSSAIQEKPRGAF